jgi:hypothetical protein
MLVAGGRDAALSIVGASGSDHKHWSEKPPVPPYTGGFSISRESHPIAALGFSL